MPSWPSTPVTSPSREKDDKSPLTEADKAAHEVIVAGLNALPEGIPVLSEEDAEGFAGADANGRYWLVDPLDGTKEFIKRNGEFTVNIALIENGKPVLGVVVAPALEVSYLAAQGVGAFKVGVGKDKAASVSRSVRPASPPKAPPGAWWAAVHTRVPIWPSGWSSSAATIWCPWAAR